MDDRSDAKTAQNGNERNSSPTDVTKPESLEKNVQSQSSKDKDEPPVSFECPVCLQTASFPVQLPCRHIFCFLCVKGVANRSKRCAMCRQEIPADFFSDPKLLRKDEVSEKSKTIFDEGFQWFYEGRNGWWQYDERTSLELENKYKEGKRLFELLIAGFLYVIDLENMRQFRRNDQTRRRKIKRDMCNIPGIKGIAGIKYHGSQQIRPSGDGGEASDSHVNPPVNPTPASNQSAPLPSVINDRGPFWGQDDSYPGTPAPNNTPQAPMTPADSQPGSRSSSQEDLSQHLQNMSLTSSSATSLTWEPPEHHHVHHHSVFDDVNTRTEDESSDENIEAVDIVDVSQQSDGVRETCL